jgi:1-acyl-sn-glycerol-3-phosphate acyltransferase
MALSASLNAGFLRAGTTLGSQLGHLRALFRLAGLTAVLTAMLAALIAARAARRVSPQLCARLRHLCKNSGALRVITLMGGRIEIVGSPPRGPCLFVSNHLGYLDVILLTALLDPVCVAKHDIAGWPVLGKLSHLFDTIFIDRKHKRDLPRVISEMTAAIDQGRTVVFFPEGTSTPGATVLPFKSSLFEAGVKSSVDVYYATLSYSVTAEVPAPQLSVCWWGDMPFASHFYRLLTLPEFRIRLVFGPEPLKAHNRKSLATAIWHRVMDDFTPVGYHDASENEAVFGNTDARFYFPTTASE